MLREMPDQDRAPGSDRPEAAQGDPAPLPALPGTSRALARDAGAAAEVPPSTLAGAVRSAADRAPPLYAVTLTIPDDFEGWRAAARALVMAKIPPERVEWLVEGDPVPLLAGGPPPAPPPDAEPPRVPRAFPDLAQLVIRHRDPARFALLHTLLHRLQRERHLLEVATDPAVARAEALAKAVRRDAHKMHAFVRFREVMVDDAGALSAPIREAIRAEAAPYAPAPARDAHSVALALRDLGPLPVPADALPSGSHLLSGDDTPPFPAGEDAGTPPGDIPGHLSETLTPRSKAALPASAVPDAGATPAIPSREASPQAAPEHLSETAAPRRKATLAAPAGPSRVAPEADAPFTAARPAPFPAPTPASRFVAWYEPDHHILRAEAGFFARRFAALRWTILTPDLSAHWDGTAVRFGPGARRSDAPAEDAAETLWRTYFANIFNPARLKPEAMRAEMPKKFWRNLPEARDIPRLIEEAPRRVAEMVARGATPPAERRQRPVHLPAHIGRAQPEAPRDVLAAMPADLLTPDPSNGDPPTGADFPKALAALRRDLLARNDLPPWTANATQPVMGEGPQHPLLMFIGEQPGDEEDLQGHPFVGPAGRLWNKAMEEAGVPRNEAYVTNSVKHFKFTPTGKRRLHQSPDNGDIAYYRPFLIREIGLVQPRLIVTLGATALRAVSGRAMPVTKLRGSLLRDPEGRPFYPTVHPSYLLRLPDPATKAREYDRFVEDLGQAAATARALP